VRTGNLSSPSEQNFGSTPDKPPTRPLYPDEENLFDHNDYLEFPYECSFKGDPALVEAVFHAVGFATQHG
jgi:hypothetical protein